MREEQKAITESHRVASELSKIKREELLFVLLLASILAFFYIKFSLNLYLDKNDKVYLEFLEEQYKKETNREKLLFLQQEKEKLLSQYRYPITLTFFSSKGNFYLKLLVYIFPILALIIFYIVIKKYLNEKRSFFYQIAKREDPIGLPKNVNLTWFKNYAHFFTDLDTILALYQKLLEKQDILKVEQTVKQNMKKLIMFLQKFYPSLLHEDYLFRFYFILMHKAISLFGNAPTGFLSGRIKDFTLKKMLSLYQLEQVPVLFIEGQFLEENYEAYVLLEVMYHANKVYKIFDFTCIDPLNK